MSRWVELYATSPSGKTMFVCRMCGQKSPVPTRSCPAPPETGGHKAVLSCELLGEMADALVAMDQAHPSTDYPTMYIYLKPNEPASGAISWKYKGQELRPSVPLVVSGRFERTPDGDLNSCALANFGEEKNCQICEGQCPDRAKYKHEGLT